MPGPRLSRPHRRRIIRAGGGLAALTLAGCLGTTGDGEDTPTATAGGTGTPGDRGVYVQPFRERMYVVGTKRRGDYAVALLYTTPHAFWNVNGTAVEKTPIDPDDAIHLMAVVWDPETRTVLPEVGVSVEIRRDGEVVSEETVYKMLSQRMGFHYGGNFPLPGDGTYTAEVSLGGMAIRRTGAFAGRFGDGATVAMDVEYTPATRDQIAVREFDRGGEPGAMKPMEMEAVPVGRAPDPASLPGEPVGRTRSGDVEYVVRASPDGGRFAGDGDAYLAVSARTRYNQLVLPMMRLAATVERGGETVVADASLAPTLDPDLDYHYGVALDDVRPGDEVTLSVALRPQVARHRGYEEAFMDVPDATVAWEE